LRQQAHRGGERRERDEQRDVIETEEYPNATDEHVEGESQAARFLWNADKITDAGNEQQDQPRDQHQDSRNEHGQMAGDRGDEQSIGLTRAKR